MTRRRPTVLLTRTEECRAELAHEAVARGRAALSDQDPTTALRWLDRAHRLVPADPNVMLALATACVDADPARAADLFRLVAEQHDIRPAWLGLAAALLRTAGPDAAAVPLGVALSQHAFLPSMQRLASQIVEAPYGGGWCGLASDGTVVVRGAGAEGVTLRLDGRRLKRAVLPSNWSRHSRLVVEVAGRPLLGSTILIDRIRRVAGFVDAVSGGVAGWAWHPADPDRPITLTLHCPRLKTRRTIVADRETSDVADAGPLARPRSFQLSRDELDWADGLIHILGPDGRDLLGSPLDPSAQEAWHTQAAGALARRYPAGRSRPTLLKHSACEEWGSLSPVLSADAPTPRQALGATRHRRAAAVVIPVHNGGRVAVDCLNSVLAGDSGDSPVIVVDDGSSDPLVVSMLGRLAAEARITLIRHPRALGFPVSANAGITAAAGHDVVLLNSDTLVSAGWLARLQDAAYSAWDIGSVTPLSNNATILSYPGEAGTNSRPDEASTRRLDTLAQRANAGRVVDIPVGVGFCLYLRRDCLAATGLLRADLFAQGYGEENDFCLRARHLGWRHVAATGVFVGHHGGASFSPTALHLRARNARILEQMHPGHDALIARFLAENPLAEDRRRIDLRRWRAAARHGQTSVILITHDHGGGVERCIAESVAIHRQAGRRAIVLRPAARPMDEAGVLVQDGVHSEYPNLVYALPREQPALLRLLRGTRPERVEVHHLLDHDAASVMALVGNLNVPYDVHVHDYAWFCQRLSLLGRHDRYCGEPDPDGCEACIADLGQFLNETISVRALRERSAAFLGQACSVIAPSQDAASRMRRHFHHLAPHVVHHEDDGALPLPRAIRRGRDLARICIVGGIGLHKGYDVLLSCARDAACRSLPLEFVLVGHSIDDRRLLTTQRVFITGRFKPEEAEDLICAQQADLGFVPSIWPETWCFSLSDIWRAGLRAAAFDIGAPAERIRRSGRGFVLPLGLQPSAINNALLAAARSGDYG